MKKILLLALLITTAHFANAQSKVFKEVNDEISTQIKLIRQDNSLVGYLAFTTLEKASSDSFNYKLTIMDENLNDIGTVSFRDEKLYLHDVSFEQDVLCLAYYKSNISGQDYTKKSDFKKQVSTAKNYIVTQFLGLDGKIIKTNSIVADSKIKASDYSSFGSNYTIYGDLKHRIQLKNIPQKGFACFYGDEKNNLLSFDTKGTQLWKKTVPEKDAYSLMTSTDNVYLLSKQKDKMVEGGYELFGFDVADGKAYDAYALKDKKGNSLKLISLDYDPTTGKPFLSGNIINPDLGTEYPTARKLCNGIYSGVFTIDVSGPKKTDIKENFSYWNDKSKEPTINNNGRYNESKSFTRFTHAFKDDKGNTYFAGSGLVKKTKWGSIISTTILSPLLIPAIWVAAGGYNKFWITDALLVKQDQKGTLKMESVIPGDHVKFKYSSMIAAYDNKSFYNVTNSNTKTNYLIVDDVKNITVYNVTQKKTARSIAHKEGSIRTNVFPAKEGHVMVSEYNKKEKYTRFSIEAL